MKFRESDWCSYSRGFSAGEKPDSRADQNPYRKGTWHSAQWKDGFYTARRLKKKPQP